ncbi:MAG: hypothetical protein R2828_07705 [Saprospiraceae bacterium]
MVKDKQEPPKTTLSPKQSMLSFILQKKEVQGILALLLKCLLDDEILRLESKIKRYRKKRKTRDILDQ